jgi:hypothetical protein
MVTGLVEAMHFAEFHGLDLGQCRHMDLHNRSKRSQLFCIAFSPAALMVD